MGYEDFFHSIVTKHNWRTFCAHLADTVVPVVREFYAHLAGEMQRSVYVHGVQVPIDDYTINQFYGLKDVEDLHHEYAANAPTEWLDWALEHGRPIDVGKIIFQGLGACAAKKCGSLWFPSLITSLCANRGVPMFDTEERLLYSKGTITKTAIARLLQVKMAEGPSQPPHNQEDGAGQAP
ncbi:hypothetical protein TIFTF001_029793 [Ficus carica]|uniref:Uncharacterized protein n=1 Tax=Ficus carica TaxID=3494 RepID=A0AA88DSY2_FICCA|nr:hypothetical protein TIFTF001_029793 [Ficus carica]